MGFEVTARYTRDLPEGQGRIDAILEVAAPAADGAAAAPRERVVIFILDTSGSMGREGRMRAAIDATQRGVDVLEPGTIFGVVAFSVTGRVVVPLQPASPATVRDAVATLGQLRPDGGTAMSTGLATARALFAYHPEAIRRAIFLTDGKNENEAIGTVRDELARCAGVFECDCWGLGTDWQVGEVQEIARTLLGRAALIPSADGVAAAFGAAIANAQSKAIGDVRLRLWTPAGAQIAFCKQVDPSIEDLTARAASLGPQLRQYPTGSWAPGEVREFHVAIEFPPGQRDEQILACRPSVVSRVNGADVEDKAPNGRVIATWTDDAARSSLIDESVARHTNQQELAAAIQTGIAKREEGDVAAATRLLGRAAQLAEAAGNVEQTTRLRKVIEYDTDPTGAVVAGTVKLKRASKAETMDVVLESTTTRRRLAGATAPQTEVH